MNVLSLFDGMSCAQIALDQLGVKVDNYFASEIEPNAIKITQKNYPSTIQIGDVNNIKVSKLPNIDLLIGGSPCQGLSFAGKRLNFDDPRSKLFFDYDRILKAVNPKYFLLENVMMDVISANTISKILGIYPIEINSELLSCGLRKRLYWTNIPNVWLPKDKGLFLSKSLDDAFTDREKSLCITANYSKGATLKRYLYSSSRQVVFTDYQFMIDLFKNNPSVDTCNKFAARNKGKWRMLSPLECERVQGVPDEYTAGVAKSWRYHMIGNGFTVEVIKHILSKMEYCSPYMKNKYPNQKVQQLNLF